MVHVNVLFGCCVFSMNSQLEQLEEEHDILSRWKPQDKEYEQLRTQLLREKLEQVRAALWSSVIKRHYLLRMKAKYAGMTINYDNALTYIHIRTLH